MISPDSKPITIFALAQVGVILLGILAAGLTRKILREATGHDASPITNFVFTWGVSLCLIPLAWVAATTYVRNHKPDAQGLGTLLLLAGPVLAIALALFLLWATLLRLCFFPLQSGL